MNDNNKTVVEIAKTIEIHRKGELKMYAINRAVGLVNAFTQGYLRRFWLVNYENNSGRSETKDFAGNIVTISGSKTTFKEDGYPVFRNTKFGEILIRYSNGIHQFPTPHGIETIEIFNNAFYNPVEQPDFARDIKINLNEAKPRYYGNLKEILEKLGDLDREIIEKQLQLEEEEKRISEQKLKDTKRAEVLIEQIDKAKKEKEETLSKMQSFIRENAELRYQPVLDPWQEEVKRSLLYNGTMAIDGGPGTGKTTSLIQRLKFLTDKTAFEDYFSHLTSKQINKISDDKCWIFFSPSELLKQYLKNNMVREGLLANDETVKVWDDHKRTLLKKYGLVNTDTQNPFLILRNRSTESLFPFEGRELKKIITSFEKFYLKHQNDKLIKIAEIDVSVFKWKNEGLSIQNYINRQDKNLSFEGLIRLYFNLEDNFSSSVKTFSKQFNDLLTKATGQVIVELEKDNAIIQRFKDLFENWKTENRSEDEDELTELDEPVEDDDESALQHGNEDFLALLFRRIKTLIRKSALMQFDKNQKLAKRDRDLNEILKTGFDLKTINDWKDVGQLAYFIKYFERVTKGIRGNLFAEIPAIYKAFRKSQLSQPSTGVNIKLLQQIVEKENDKNKRLHPEEQAFLIYFINEFIKRSYRVSISKSDEINHPYFIAFREMCKPVIGIDEATDFHLLDLLCMHSLGDIDISSVTLSGDLMQRLTNVGLRDWDALRMFIPKLEPKELMVSYRQSSTLLKLAQQIYRNATERDAEYISYLDYNKNEPKPLLYVNDDETECIEWIAKRILEIYKAYGNNIPSIAVFLPDEKDLAQFARNLGEIDALADVNISVMACSNGQILGADNTVRVFSLNYIKGLEFEAVFFHHIDKVINESSADLMFKNLYVGLSRATFYLGITSSEQVQKIAKLPGIETNSGYTWKIV
jgi:hypothetical protein